MTQNSTPATDAGHTEAAGAGLDDDELVEQVAGQTDPNLGAEDAFEREADGTSTDAPASDTTADDLA